MKARVETLDVVVERIPYPKPNPLGEDGDPLFYILVTDRGTCKGQLSWRPFDGERLTLSGNWKAYNGQLEFAFTAAVPNLPVDPRDSLHYAVERTLGMGPALEQAIWDKRGEEWAKIEAGEIKRLDGKLFAAWTETCGKLLREKEKSEAVAWMIGRGATVAVATLAWDKWSTQTRSVVSSDPYRLDELPGYGFSYVDRSVRHAFQVGDSDTRRIRAAIRYSMTSFADDGHSAVRYQDVHDKANEILGGLWSDLVIAQSAVMFDDGVLHPFGRRDWRRYLLERAGRRHYDMDPLPVSACRAMVSLGSDATAAGSIWSFANNTQPQQATPAGADATPFDGLPPQQAPAAAGSFTLDESQLGAVAFALARPFAAITGGAGTGKTTIIKEIVRQAGGPVSLCALAGKAASRMREATGHDASTIHRLLGCRGDVFTTPTLEGRTVIVDEASMLDEHLLHEIVRREPKRLILVGDDAQLPPVGRGQPFHDLIRLRPDLVRRLTTCYRQTEAVFKAASMVRVGEMPPLRLESAQERWTIQAVGEPEETEAAILEMVKAGKLDFAQDILLTPTNGKGDEESVKPCTVKSLNLKIRELANPDHGPKRIDLGDRVICTKNFPGADVWNGTTGRVQAIDSGSQIWVETDLPVLAATGEKTNLVLFTAEMRQHLQLAYALTVHKAQGSQYRNVVFVALYRDTACMLDRKLAYTAVTRAKSTCTVIGQPRALQVAVGRVLNRTTALQEVSKETV